MDKKVDFKPVNIVLTNKDELELLLILFGRDATISNKLEELKDLDCVGRAKMQLLMRKIYKKLFKDNQNKNYWNKWVVRNHTDEILRKEIKAK